MAQAALPSQPAAPAPLARLSASLPLAALPACIVSALGGVAQALAFPEAGLWPLAFACAIPLYLSCYRQTRGLAFLCGWLYGLALGLASFSWLTGVMSGYGGLGPWGGAAVMLALAAFLALYQGIFGLLCAGWDAEGKGFLVNPLLAALWWTGLDFLKGWVFTGFNWTPLGGALAQTPRLAGAADLLGAWGLSFPVALSGFLLCSLAALPWRARAWEAVTAAAGALSCLMLVSLYGIVTYNIWEDEVRAVRDERVKRLAVLQASVGQEYKWDAAYRAEILGRYRRLALEAAEAGPYLVVWSETAAPFVYGRDLYETSWLQGLLAEAGRPMLVGVAAEAGSEAGAAASGTGRRRLRNRAWLLYPDGTEGPYYDKRHLVPFGEYVPMLEELPILSSAFLQGVLGAAGDFTPGGRRPLLEYAGDGADPPVRIGALICFESIFPYLARRHAIDGADLLLVTTNDAWFGQSAAPVQHFFHAAMRAVENRLPLARAANGGISGLFSPSGRALYASPRDEEAVYYLDVPLAGRPGRPTVYARFGWAFAPGCAILTGLSLLWLLGRGIARRRAEGRLRAGASVGAGSGSGSGGDGGAGGPGGGAGPGKPGAPLAKGRATERSFPGIPGPGKAGKRKKPGKPKPRHGRKK
jgi:apolipoprotein N-acyltransferase